MLWCLFVGFFAVAFPVLPFCYSVLLFFSPVVLAVAYVALVVLGASAVAVLAFVLLSPAVGVAVFFVVLSHIGLAGYRHHSPQRLRSTSFGDAGHRLHICYSSGTLNLKQDECCTRKT